MKNKRITVTLDTYEWKNILCILMKEDGNFGWMIYRELPSIIASIKHQTKIKIRS